MEVVYLLKTITCLLVVLDVSVIAFFHIEYKALKGQGSI